MPRRKVTGFTRFLLVMIVLIPLAFAAAALYNGKDPIVEAKRLLGLEQTENNISNTPERNINQPPQKNNGNSTTAPAAEIEALQQRIEKLERDQAELQQRLRQQELEIKELKRQRSK